MSYSELTIVLKCVNVININIAIMFFFLLIGECFYSCFWLLTLRLRLAILQTKSSSIIYEYDGVSFQKHLIYQNAETRYNNLYVLSYSFPSILCLNFVSLLTFSAVFVAFSLQKPTSTDYGATMLNQVCISQLMLSVTGQTG